MKNQWPSIYWKLCNWLYNCDVAIGDDYEVLWILEVLFTGGGAEKTATYVEVVSLLPDEGFEVDAILYDELLEEGDTDATFLEVSAAVVVSIWLTELLKLLKVVNSDVWWT